MKINEPSSFRDPSAHIFSIDGVYYRHLHTSYQSTYELLMDSGLYEKLVTAGQLISHEETDLVLENAFKVIKPQQLDFINYPYEWSFSQLKDAALLTLKIQKQSIECGLSLKDATGFNIVFIGNKPLFIDSSSFEIYDQLKPWVAYRQFCECFLGPLLLARYLGSENIGMLLQYPDGIPISLVSQLLPWKSRFSLVPVLHIHLQKAIGSGKVKPTPPFSRKKLLRIIDHLEKGISRLSINEETTVWSKYYQKTILLDNYLDSKKKAFLQLCAKISFERVLDLGANTGEFSKLMSLSGKQVIATDADRVCVDGLYLSSDERTVSLVVDVMNPTPAIGWLNKERRSFLKRSNADLVLALALVHHLCIGKNLPFENLAEGLSYLGEYLIIEFIPKSDPKVQELLAYREDVFMNYTELDFTNAFTSRYDMVDSSAIAGTHRKLYLFRKKMLP